jgi:hypothetical protein
MTIATLICVCPIPLCQLCKLNTFFQFLAMKESCMFAQKNVICSVHPHRFVVIWVAVTTVETRSEYIPVSLFRNFNHMNNLKCFRTRSWLGKLTMMSNGQTDELILGFIRSLNSRATLRAMNEVSLPSLHFTAAVSFYPSFWSTC